MIKIVLIKNEYFTLIDKINLLNNYERFDTETKKQIKDLNIPSLDIILNNSVKINDNEKVQCEYCNEY